ncbi:hypothetical protein H4R19_000972 [Coemansia spiralis]|nr:hypothetical protein H4R19_000972 [Coemansia spiralis]
MVQAHVYPPLGALTGVREATIPFRVYCVRSAPKDPGAGEVEIWTNMFGAEWQGIPLQEASSAGDCGNGSGGSEAPELALLDLAQLGPVACVQQFRLDADAAAAARRFEFTVRWRHTAGSGDWQWVAGFEHNASVVVYWPLPSARGNPLNFWRQQLRQLMGGPASPGGRPAPAPVAEAWAVSADGASCLLRPNDPDASGGEHALCQLAGAERYLAFVRSDNCWIAPRCGIVPIDTGDQELLLLLVELCSGCYAALMPYVRGDADSGAAVLSVQQPGRLFVRRPPAAPSAAAVRVAVGIHQDPHCAVADAMARVQEQISAHHRAPVPSAGSVAAPAHPCALSRHLGYCTWNAFYQAVDHDQIVSALRSLGARADQPQPGWVLIDDGWQTVDAYGGHGRLRDMHADERKFPGQLKRTVEVLTGLGIRRVGVWHALWGYWGGIDPAGPLAQQYAVVACHRRRSLGADRDSELLLISPDSVHAFYDAFYAWLRAEGVSFVKVDYQGAFEALDSYAGASPQDAPAAIAAMRAAYYSAMESAALKHFGPGSVIYCMAQSPYVVVRALRWQQQSAVDGAACGAEHMVFRNSDDYIPEDAASHGWHIYCNMANAVWSRTLGDYFTADWDMFRPGQPTSEVHAAARALSGGPVYITATGADMEAADLRGVAGSDGSVAPRLPPLLDSHCLFSDMTAVPAVLVASITAPKANAVAVAIFNVSRNTVIAPVAVSRIYAEAMQRLERQNAAGAAGALLFRPTSVSLRGATDGVAGDWLAIHQHSTGRVRVVAAADTPAYVFGLGSLAWDVVTVARMAPIRSMDRSAILFAACIGDTSRYGGVAAVERSVCSMLTRGVPGSPRPSPPPPAQRLWSVRVRVGAGSRQATFVFSSREAGSDGRQLPITVQNVWVSSNDADWHFDSATGALRVAMGQGSPAASVTVSLCA